MSQIAGQSDSSPRPFFSVVMPVYNHLAYVEPAVRSVMGQTFRDWELLAVDDGSTDGSAELLDRLAKEDPRIVAVHQANAGQSAARNAGIARSRAGWIAYLDSDDVWLKDALSDYAAHLSAHPAAAFIYGYRHRLNEDGSVTELPSRFQDGPTGAAELFEHVYLSPLRVCHRRELLDRSGPWDEGLRVCEDYDLFLRMGLHCRYEPIGKAVGLRRRHEGNISRLTGRTAMTEAEILRRFVERYGGEDVLDPARVKRRLHRLYCRSAREYFRGRDYVKASAALALAHRYRRTAGSLALAALARCLRSFNRDDGNPLPKLL